MRGTRRVCLAIRKPHPRHHKISDRFKIKASSCICQKKKLRVVVLAGSSSTEGIKWMIQVYHQCHFRTICILLIEASRVLPVHRRFGPSVDANLFLLVRAKIPTSYCRPIPRSFCKVERFITWRFSGVCYTY
jgi:hypothetical protein